MNAPGLECIDGEDQDRHLIDMPHAAFAVLPSAALEEFNKKYGHLGPALDAGGRRDARRLVLV